MNDHDLEKISAGKAPRVNMTFPSEESLKRLIKEFKGGNDPQQPQYLVSPKYDGAGGRK